MPAARYWRATGISAYGGGDIELSAFHLIGVGGSRVDQTATLSCAFAPISGALSNLQDADTATVARFDPRSPGFALVWDFGAGNTADISTAAIGSSASIDRFLSHYDLQHSSDGQNWTQFLRQGRFVWPGANAMQTPVVADPNADLNTLLLNFNGSFVDTSVLNQSITVQHGSPGITTSIVKYGSGAGDFRKTGTVLIPSGMNFGTGDFTVECWVYWNTAVGAQELGIFQLSTASGYEQSNANLALFVVGTGKYAFYLGSYVPTSVDVQTLTWTHIAISRASGTLRFFVNGQNVFQTSNSYNFNKSQGVIGGYYGSNFNGDAVLDDFRVTRGLARYTANFTPPNELSANAFGIVDIPRLATRVGTPEAFAASPPVGAVGGRAVTNPRNLRDLQFAGRGRISGTVKEDIDPVDRPVRRRVRLVRDRDGIVVRETWSDPTTGAYEFTEIDENATYSAISYDHTNNYRAVIADNLTPTVT